MKSPIRSQITCFIAITLLAASGAFARTWTSADGKSTFEGELIGYDAATGQVTLERDGRRITYRRELLSTADIAFLDGQAKAAPQPMPPIAGNWKPIPELTDEFEGEKLDKVVHEMENTHWHQPLNMIFDSETFPDWFGLPDKKSLPATFSIEYIRSWSRTEDG